MQVIGEPLRKYFMLEDRQLRIQTFITSSSSRTDILETGPRRRTVFVQLGSSNGATAMRFAFLAVDCHILIILCLGSIELSADKGKIKSSNIPGSLFASNGEKISTKIISFSCEL